MRHLSMKLSDTFDQNPPCTFDKIRENSFQRKTLSTLGLESQGQGNCKNQKPMPWGTKNMPPKKNLSRDSPNFWCPTDLSNML